MLLSAPLPRLSSPLELPGHILNCEGGQIDKRNLCEFGWNHPQVHGNVLLFVNGFVEYCELTHQ